MSWAILLILSFLIVSIVFNGLGTIGLHRFPDVYTRLHAATKCTTFGTIFMTFTVIAHSVRLYLITEEARFLNMAIHTFLALVALLITNPTGAHAIARAAHIVGIKQEQAESVWFLTERDELREADLEQTEPVSTDESSESSEVK